MNASVPSPQESPVTVEVDIWSDVVCPWCYIGKRRFESAVAQYTERRPEVVFEVRYRAFMLDPSAPESPESVLKIYERKFGGSVAARSMIDRVTAEAEGEGLVFNLDRAQRANTLSAHRLLVLAREHGVQMQMKEELMAAYFTDGVDIANQADLVALAVEAGLDEATVAAWLADGQGRNDVIADLKTATEQGITGVPGYVFNRSGLVAGAQPDEVFISVFDQLIGA